ncbi:hypothetical protein D918_04752 [Trichuris suis]|nr:hypothetical protein D918_04752 [Trichuris suis]
MKTPQKSILKKPTQYNGRKNDVKSRSPSEEAGNQDNIAESSAKKSVVRFLRRNTYPDQVATTQHEAERNQRVNQILFSNLILNIFLLINVLWQKQLLIGQSSKQILETKAEQLVPVG